MFLTNNQDLFYLRENWEDIEAMVLCNGNVKLVNIIRLKEFWVKKNSPRQRAARYSFPPFGSHLHEGDSSV